MFHTSLDAPYTWQHLTQLVAPFHVNLLRLDLLACMIFNEGENFHCK